MTLPVGDIPRQISKDSGRGSLSPTSTHGSLDKEPAMKEVLLNPQTVPGDYSMAVTAHVCLHGNATFSLNCDKNAGDSSLFI
jgi:hypothetical protein